MYTHMELYFFVNTYSNTIQKMKLVTCSHFMHNEQFITAANSFPHSSRYKFFHEVLKQNLKSSSSGKHNSKLLQVNN